MDELPALQDARSRTSTGVRKGGAEGGAHLSYMCKHLQLLQPRRRLLTPLDALNDRGILLTRSTALMVVRAHSRTMSRTRPGRSEIPF